MLELTLLPGCTAARHLDTIIFASPERVVVAGDRGEGGTDAGRAAVERKNTSRREFGHALSWRPIDLFAMGYSQTIEPIGLHLIVRDDVRGASWISTEERAAFRDTLLERIDRWGRSTPHGT